MFKLVGVIALGLSLTACETIKTGQTVYDAEGNMYEKQLIVHYPLCTGSCAERVKTQK